MRTASIQFKDISALQPGNGSEKKYPDKAVIIDRINQTKSQMRKEDELEKFLWFEKMNSPTANSSEINYQVSATLLGEIMIASTGKGICYAGFTDGESKNAFADMKRRFPGAILTATKNAFHQEAINKLNHPERNDLPLRLHLKGTDFQLAIWKKLLKIPFGGLMSYTTLAGNAHYARATATAVGDNPVCYLIPCHRVVRSNGQFDGYFWGTDLKKSLLGWEAAATKNILPH